MAVIMLLGIACGVLYTAGPKPLAYLGLGDVFVLIFFGPVAVAGTHFAQTNVWSPDATLVGLAPGLLAVGILVMNNLRDLENDREAGKRTVAVRFGVKLSQYQYAVCLQLPLFLVAGLIAFRQAHWGGLMTLAAGVPVLHALRTVFQYRQPEELIPMLGRTAGLLLIFSILFSLGWVLS